MLVYREDDWSVDIRHAWRALCRRADALSISPDPDEVTAVLIEVGELWAAIADAITDEAPQHPAAGALTEAGLAAGELFVASRRAPDACGRRVDELRNALSAVQLEYLPASATRRVSEGYAHYALHPETYMVAADRFASRARPAAVHCIGIRSIGTSLSAVVAATLKTHAVPVRLWTVRPGGHPFDRELHLEGTLRSALQQDREHAHYAIVDEGPGLSGSSFASTARAIAELGIARERIALFPSWNAHGSSFRSDMARREWERHDRYVAAPEDAGVGIHALVGGRQSVEWSAGRWRETFFADRADWPAVQPQHERVKRLLPDDAVVIRFAGLGHYGDSRRERAAAFAAADLGSPPESLLAGYLAIRFVPGRPCARGDFDEVLAKFVARYLAFVAQRFPAERRPSLEHVHHMIETNLTEADHRLPVPLLRSFGPALADAAAAVLDGRMLAHEFIRTGDGGIVKTDALDHGDGHFFPGPQDVAWDIAAVEAEFRLDRAASKALIDAYTRISGDRFVGKRLPFYRLAYAAFQLGYATMARAFLGDTPEGQRFERRREEFLARACALTSVA